MAIDVETCDPQLRKLGCGVRRDGYLVGVGFAIEDGPSHYLPFAHLGGDNLDRAQVFAYLRDQGKVFRGEIVLAGGQYDLDYLWSAGVVFTPSAHRDVQIAEPLLDELQWSYSLNAIAERHGIPGKNEDALRAAAECFDLDPKKDLWKLPARYVGAYCEQDCRLPLKLLRKQEPLIDEQGLRTVYDMECALLPVLLRMRRRGVRLDFDQLAKVERWSMEQELAALVEISRLTGVKMTPAETTKPRQLDKVFQSVGIKLPRTGKSGEPSVKATVLNAIVHPIADLVRRAQKMHKLRTTFVESIYRHAVGNRIHTTFNQLKSEREDGTGTGGTIARLSSTMPNLQQQPIRDPEIGALWRAIFLPDDGHRWACIDLSQQEPRWMVHYAEATKCKGAAEAAERFRKDPNIDNHSMMAEFIDSNFVLEHYQDPNHPRHAICKQIRDEAKTVFLGKCYGMGGAKFCQTRGLPTEWVEINGRMREVAGPEGRRILQRFDDGVPYIRELTERAAATAKERGYIVTRMGRRARFPRGAGGAYDWVHKALNRLIQGTSADQTKRAMVEADREGIPMQLQVHDELDLSWADPTTLRRLAECMRDALPCNVPHKTDIEVGPNWANLEKWDGRGP